MNARDHENPLDLIAWDSFSPEAYTGDSPAPRFIGGGLFPVGEVGVLAGEGGIGKSFLTLVISESIDAPCFSLFSEDSRPNIDHRLVTIRKSLGTTGNPASRYVATASIPEDCRLMAFNAITGEVDELPMFEVLRRHLDAWQAAGHSPIVFLDNLTSLITVDSNKAEQAGPALAKLNALAQEFEASVIVLHHMTKSSGREAADWRTRIRGSGAIVDASRFAYTMHAASAEVAATVRSKLDLDGDAEIVALALVKSNGPLRRAPTYYARQPDGFLLELPRVDFLSDEDALVELIRGSASNGQRYKLTGRQGLFESQLPTWPGRLGNMGRDRLRALARSGLATGRIVTDADGFLVIGVAADD